MAETPVHVANERVKGLAACVFNLGTGLAAATAARMWSDAALSVVAALWLAGAAILIWIASQLLTLLEPEV